MNGTSSPAEGFDRLGTKLDKSLSSADDIRALGRALLHVLLSAEGRDHEPLETAIALARVIEEQASSKATSPQRPGWSRRSPLGEAEEAGYKVAMRKRF
jgi:hypothetical protein